MAIKIDLDSENPLNKISGNCIVDTSTSNNGACTPNVNGTLKCPVNTSCGPWELTDSTETCIIDDYIAESLNIGGSNINVHKLLGIHEQGLLQDLTGNGNAISSRTLGGFPAKNAFDKFISEWRSAQTGADVVSDAYIGYDFGPIRLDNGRLRYGVETYVKHDISRFKIKQSCNKKNRATKVRVERSSDGNKWFGVAIVNLPDCEDLVTLDIKRTVPSRWWRFRPVEFNGGKDDYWAVQAIQLIEYEQTHITNIQDKIFLENRDRDYDELSVRLKGQYSPIDAQSFLGKFGIFAQDTYNLEFNFSEVVSRLGRPFVIGDILQLPSETQFSPTLRPVLKYLEITDVTWSSNGYTPTWQPLIQRITAGPLIASQETQDITGKLTRDFDKTGLADIDSGEHSIYQDWSDVDQTIKADANTKVPEDGTDYADVQQFSDELLEFSDKHPDMNLSKYDRIRNMYGIDALPPNGLPFTQGDDFPEKPKNGVYHRLTYTNIGTGIPARLYRFSANKDRWIFLEADRRDRINNNKSLIAEYTHPNRGSITAIDEIPEALKPKI